MRSVLGLLTCLVLVAGCTGGGAREPVSPPTTDPQPRPTPVASETISPECEPGEGRTVTQLPDLRIDPVVVEDVLVPGADIAGERVDGGVVEGFVLQGQLVDGGCIIEYAAPGGCLGAVEITGAALPPATLPATSVPAVVLPDGTRVEGEEIPAVEVDGVSTAAVRAGQVCQVEQDGELPTVTRAGVVREALSRNGIARPGTTRPEHCVEGGCLPPVEVETVRLEPVRLDDVDVDPGRLERRTLQGSSQVGVVTGEDRTSYVAPGDLLFALDSATLGPDVEPVLRAVAVEVARTQGPVVVEGHTDDQGTEAYNVDLSLRRAQAVAEWLTTTGGIDRSRIEVAGLGESAPAYGNTDDTGRALNRRVVVTVLDG